jgi:hypothetical protein
MDNFKNSIWFGIIIGICVPIVGAAITKMVFEQLANADIIPTIDGKFSINQERTIWVIGIIFNLIPFQIFKAKRSENVMKGILYMTLIAVTIWVIIYSRSIFQ